MKPYIPLLFMLVLTIILTNLLQIPSIPLINRQYRGSNEVDINFIINDVASRLNLNTKDPKIRYNLYYSGRILVFKAYEIRSIIGLKPTDILFGYYDGSSWRALPVRIYDDIINTSEAIIYTLPQRIGNNTYIQLKLPSNYPVKTDPSSNKPPFARGSRCISITLIDTSTGMEVGTIYLFIGGTAKIHSRNYINTYRDYGVNDGFTASEPPQLLKYLSELNYDAQVIVKVMDVIINKPIVLHKDIEWRIELEPPVPDGGGGSPSDELPPNLIEIRNQPTKTMIEHDLELSLQHPEHVIKIRIYNDYSFPLVWITLVLTITIGREEPLSVGKQLNIKIYNYDYDYEYNDIKYIVGDRVNIIRLTYTPAPYGTSCEYVYVKLWLSDYSGGEKWGFRIIPSVHILSFYDLDDNANKKIQLSLIHGCKNGEESTIRFYVDDQVGDKRIDKKILFIEPQIYLAFPHPHRKITIRFNVRIPDADQNLYPFKVRMNLGGIAENVSEELTYDCYGGNLIINVNLIDLIRLYEEYRKIPLTITVESYGQNPGDYTAFLKIRQETPVIIVTRPLRTKFYQDNTVLSTSTYPEDSTKWVTDNYFDIGRITAMIANNPNNDNNIYMKSYTIQLIRDSLRDLDDTYISYRIVVSAKGFSTSIDTGTSNELIIDPVTDSATISIYFPPQYDLSGATISVYDFNLEGTLPRLPEIPAPAAVILSKIPYVGSISTAYSLFAWSWNMVAEQSRDNIIPVKGDHYIEIYWDKGLLSNHDFNGRIHIDNVYSYVPPGFGKQISIEFKVDVAYANDDYELVIRG